MGGGANFISPSLSLFSAARNALALLAAENLVLSNGPRSVDATELIQICPQLFEVILNADGRNI